MFLVASTTVPAVIQKDKTAETNIDSYKFDIDRLIETVNHRKPDLTPELPTVTDF